MVTVKYIRGGQVKKMAPRYATILIKMGIVEIYNRSAIVPAAPVHYATKPLGSEVVKKEKKEQKKKKDETGEPKKKKPRTPKNTAPAAELSVATEYQTKVMAAEPSE